MVVSSGFSIDNIFPFGEYDIEESSRRFAAQWKKAVKDKYPYIDLIVYIQSNCKVITSFLKTKVVDFDEFDNVNELNLIIEDIDNIQNEVWASKEWLVELT